MTNELEEIVVLIEDIVAGDAVDNILDGTHESRKAKEMIGEIDLNYHLDRLFDEIREKVDGDTVRKAAAVYLEKRLERIDPVLRLRRIAEGLKEDGCMNYALSLESIIEDMEKE